MERENGPLVKTRLNKFSQLTHKVKSRPRLSRYDCDETGVGDHFLASPQSYLHQNIFLHSGSSCALIQLPDDTLTIFAVRDSGNVRKYTLIAESPSGKILDINIEILKGRHAGQRYSIDQYFDRRSDPERFFEHYDPDPRVCELKLDFRHRGVRVEQVLEFEDRTIPRSRLRSVRNIKIV